MCALDTTIQRLLLPISERVSHKPVFFLFFFDKNEMSLCLGLTLHCCISKSLKFGISKKSKKQRFMKLFSKLKKIASKSPSFTCATGPGDQRCMSVEALQLARRGNSHL